MLDLCPPTMWEHKDPLDTNMVFLKKNEQIKGENMQREYNRYKGKYKK